MDFCVEYPKLEPPHQERFRAIITHLLAGRVLTPGTPLSPDPDWRFAERHRDLLDAYLRIGGWRLDIDLGLRLCRAVHMAGAQRVRFNKLESLVLCILRLVYHEQMQQATEEMLCDLKVGELRERIVQAGKPVAQLSRRALADALRRLSRHSLISIDRGFSGEDSDNIVVSPLMEKVLPPERVAELAERVRSYVTPSLSTGAADSDDSDEAEEEGS
jgi:Domain of unknown function (DUF4194)